MTFWKACLFPDKAELSGLLMVTVNGLWLVLPLEMEQDFVTRGLYTIMYLRLGVLIESHVKTFFKNNCMRMMPVKKGLVLILKFCQ